MPRKRKATKISRKTTKRVVSKGMSKKEHSTKWFKWGESYTSLMLGIVVVIIGVLFIASFARNHHVQETSSTSTVMQPTPTASQEEYVVKEGDSLWSISETVYGTGYNWVAIAKANNLTNPGSIEIGQKLMLPKLQEEPTPTPTTIGFPTTNQPQNQNPQAISGNSYVVQKGDNLWDIAVRAYADGYKWVDIAKANNLTNPGLIFSGNTLAIPR